MNVKGRRVAIGAVVAGAVVLVWAGTAFDDELVEQWYLWMLDSADEGQQELAAEKLGRMGSKSAIPRLMEIFGRELALAHEKPFAWAVSPDGSRITSKALVWNLFTGKRTFIDVRSHYSFKALVRIGRPTVSALRELLEDEDQGTRLAAAVALNEIDPGEHPEEFVLRALEEALTTGSESSRLRRSAGDP